MVGYIVGYLHVLERAAANTLDTFAGTASDYCIAERRTVFEDEGGVVAVSLATGARARDAVEQLHASVKDAGDCLDCREVLGARGSGKGLLESAATAAAAATTAWSRAVVRRRSASSKVGSAAAGARTATTSAPA